ncbi:MAG: hypothetical protein PHE55_21540, partial [Methylococcaceae bacterium]|nr:hypothetical protein [Methylococcaceae bacterium]
WSGAQPVSGRLNLTGLNTRQTYTLTCTGSGGTVSQTVTVTAPLPIPVASSPSSQLFFRVLKATNRASIVLTWLSSNANSCAASGAWSGTKSISGAQRIAGPNLNQVYTLTCTGSGDAVSKTIVNN